MKRMAKEEDVAVVMPNKKDKDLTDDYYEIPKYGEYEVYTE